MDDSTPQDEFLIAEQAFVEGDSAHAVKHLGTVLVADPERREALDLAARIAADSDDPIALLPDDNYVGTEALRAFYLARAGKNSDAFKRLLSCVTALPDSRLLIWLQ